MVTHVDIGNAQTPGKGPSAHERSKRSSFSHWKGAISLLGYRLMGHQNEKMRIMQEENRRFLAHAWVEESQAFHKASNLEDRTERDIALLVGNPKPLFGFALMKQLASYERIKSLGWELRMGSDFQQETATRSLAYIVSDPEAYGKEAARQALRILRKSARDTEMVEVEEPVEGNGYAKAALIELGLC